MARIKASSHTPEVTPTSKKKRREDCGCSEAQMDVEGKGAR